jgi:hypothetical protein
VSWPLARRLRRNHALEHATISILQQRDPAVRIIARSTSGGFRLYGITRTDEVRVAVDEAMRRLRGGEHNLAIARRCGTTVAVGVVLGTIGLWLSEFMRSPRQKLALGAATSFAIAVSSQPVGLLAQRYLTTESEMGSLKVRDVRTRSLGRRRYLEVRTA